MHNLKFQKPQLWTGILEIVILVIILTSCLANRKSEDGIFVTDTESVDTNTHQTLQEEKNLENQDIHRVGVRSVSLNDRSIIDYVDTEEAVKYGYMSSYDKGEPLLFSEDCVFRVNYGMSKSRYETVDFTVFANLIEECKFSISKRCILTFENGFVTEALLESAYYQYGIYPNDSQEFWWYTTEELQEQLKNDYEKISMEYADIASCEGEEVIETYIGNMGDGDSGWVLIKDMDGNILHSEFAHVSRADWNNIYIGEDEEGSFLLKLHIEDRWTHGEYRYRVFRLAADGEIEQIAGSTFGFGDLFLYNDDLFREWIGELEPYLKSSHLLLSSQEAEIRTEHVSEAERYNYENLNLNSRPYITE